MQLSIQQAERIMRKLEVELIQCSHHVRGFVTFNGTRLFAIHCSFGRKDLPGNVPHRFRKALKLTVAEFEILKGCTMSRAQYFDVLRQKGIIG
jgi:hypothetical protein